MTKLRLPPHFLEEPVDIDIVGAGGNGSQMLYGLARLHFALLALGHPHGLRVTLYDPDIVSPANVGRQLFSPSDVGHAKAAILIHRVNMFYGLTWSAAVSNYRNCAGHGSDLVIGCVDSAASRREILTVTRRAWNCWWLDLGNSAHTGQVVLGREQRIIDKHRARKAADMELECSPPTIMELFPSLADPAVKEDNAPSCSLAEALEKQDLFINQSVATFALHLLWTWFRQGHLEHHGYFINLKLGRVAPMPIDPIAWKRLADANKSRKRVKKATTPKATPKKSRNAYRK
jgi:PRTRC genetic system ThiF family protein